MTNNPVSIGNTNCGHRCPLVIIAGPCVLQDEALTLTIAEQLKQLCADLGLGFIFKASFDKANRTSVDAYRGPGLHEGMRLLGLVKQKLQVPVTTDIHEPAQAAAVAEVCDLLQIPAFLARQTDLLLAAAATGRPVNVKKGQFMAPSDMRHVIGKLNHGAAQNVLVCERGTFFGYGRLVNDMRGLVELREFGAPVIFDATHSVQEPGGLGAATGGKRQFVPYMARAAVAVGVDGLFFETHPDPDSSPSDGPNMIPLDEVGELLKQLVALRETVEKFS